MNDYRELPERLAAAVARLISAERTAHPERRCSHCGRSDTMNVENAEVQVLAAIRREYVPLINEQASADRNSGEDAQATKGKGS